MLSNIAFSRFLFLLYIIPPFSKFTRPFCKLFLYFFQLFSSSKSEITKPIFKQFKCCFQMKSNDLYSFWELDYDICRWAIFADQPGKFPSWFIIALSLTSTELHRTCLLQTTFSYNIQVCDSHRWTEWPPYVPIRLSYLYKKALGKFPNEPLQTFIAQVAKLATWQFIRQLANLASWNVYSLIISLTQLDRLTGWNEIIDVGKFPTWR